MSPSSPGRGFYFFLFIVLLFNCISSVVSKPFRFSFIGSANLMPPLLPTSSSIQSQISASNYPFKHKSVLLYCYQSSTHQISFSQIISQLVSKFSYNGTANLTPSLLLTTVSTRSKIIFSSSTTCPLVCTQCFHAYYSDSSNHQNIAVMSFVPHSPNLPSSRFSFSDIRISTTTCSLVCTQCFHAYYRGSSNHQNIAVMSFVQYFHNDIIVLPTTTCSLVFTHCLSAYYRSSINLQILPIITCSLVCTQCFNAYYRGSNTQPSSAIQLLQPYSALTKTSKEPTSTTPPLTKTSISSKTSFLNTIELLSMVSSISFQTVNSLLEGGSQKDQVSFH